MTRFLLDTSTCVDAITRRGRVLARLAEVDPLDVAVSAVTVAEVWYGASKSSAPAATRAAAEAFLQPIAILDFDRHAAEAYADIRVGLEARGQVIGERDLMIASTASANKLTVVTHNVREFRRVPGLAVEDWY